MLPWIYMDIHDKYYREEMDGDFRGWRLGIVNFHRLVRQGDGMSCMAIWGEVFGGREN